MAKIKSLLLTISLFSMGNVSAQQLSLTGKIVNLKKQPVEFMNVVLLKNDSIFVQTTISDSLGLFILKADKGNYSLLLKQFGSEFLKRNILLNQDANLGELVIDESVTLEGVVITSRKRLIERKVDRLVFNVQDMVTMSGADASEVLLKIPGIRIQNNSVALIGKDAINIMVNDKPLLLSGEELLNFLKTINYGNISKIEVITNPPAKYNAEGNSGIINIILKNAKLNEWDAAIYSNYTQTTFARGTWGGNFSWQKNKLSIFSNIDYGYGSKQITYLNHFYYPSQIWTTESPTRTFNNGINTRLGIDYKINNKWTTGIQYLGNFLKSPGHSNRKIDILDMTTNKIDSTIRTISNKESKSDIVALSYYNKFDLDSLSRSLYFSLDYFTFSSDLISVGL